MDRILQDNNDGIRDRLMYDPVVKGLDASFWKTIAGTPSATGGNLRLNQAEISSYSQYVYGDYVFALNVATTPSAGESKKWGLRNQAHLTLGGAYFEITGATFRAVTYDDTGTAETTNITWNSRGQTWEAAMVLYRIVWTKRSVQFYVTTLAAPTAEGDFYVEHKTRVPTMPLALNIDNEADADNLDIDWVLAKRIGKLIT